MKRYKVGFVFSFSLLTLLALFVLLGCTPQERPDYVQAGSTRDTVASVEARGKNIGVVWLTHDDITAYCFPAGIDAKELIDHKGEIIIDYRSPNSTNSEDLPCRQSEPGQSITVEIVTGYRLVDSR